MIRRILLLMLLPCLVYAQGMQPVGNAMGTSAAPTSCTGMLVCQNFETATTGYDNSETFWAADGAGVNPSYGTGALKGTQSLRLATTGAYGVTGGNAFSNLETSYGFFRLKLTADPSVTMGIMDNYDNDNSESRFALKLVPGSAGHFQIRATMGSTNADSASTFDTGTIYYVWYYWDSTVTDTGTCWVRVGTSGTYSSAGSEISYSNGTTVGGGTHGAEWFGVGVWENATVTYLMDQILVKATAIGDVN